MKIFQFILPVLTVGVLLLGCLPSDDSQHANTDLISNFEQCVSAGGNIMESDPMQCAIRDKVFVDETILVTILAIKPEKDGHSLKVQDMAGEAYDAVISIPNLGPNSTFDFDDLQVGNNLRLKGEVWDLAGVPQITASYAEYAGKAEMNSGGYCSITDAKDLNIWINAMPSPDGPVLIAIFAATMPTPGYSFIGEVMETQKTNPPSYVLDITPTPPSGMVAQVLTPTEVRLDIPVESTQAQSVTLTCAGKTLFTVNEVTTAW